MANSVCVQTNNHLIFMVKHSGIFSAIKGYYSWGFDTFMTNVKGKLGTYTENLSLTYDMCEYNGCELNSCEDWDVFICLARLFTPKVVNIAVVPFDPTPLVTINCNYQPQYMSPLHSAPASPQNEPNCVQVFGWNIASTSSNQQVTVHTPQNETQPNKRKQQEPFFPGSQSQLPVFDICQPQKQVTLLSSGWVNNITHVGQEFLGGVKEFRSMLAKYAAKVGFKFKYIRNDSTYVHARCIEDYALDCGWFVSGSLHPVTRTFFIKQGNLKHSCPPRVLKSDNKRLGMRIIGELIQEQIRAAPATSPTKVKDDLILNYGFKFAYDKVWRAVLVARSNIFGSYSESFNELQWYKSAIQHTNPGSEVVLEFDQTTRKFTRFFVAFKAMLEGFKSCRPMLFVEGTFMKSNHKGTLLAATAKDGNNGLFPVAFAIVDQENGENWTWFIRKLSEVCLHPQEVMYVSDRAGGLLCAFKQVFDNPLHFYCLYHLMKNLRTHYKGKIYSDIHKNTMCKLLKDMAYAPNERLFEAAQATFLRKGKDVAADFLVDLPPNKWAVAFNPDVLRYGELTSNAAESFNSWILKARGLPITYMVDCIRQQIMEWIVQRRAESDKWTWALTKDAEVKWNAEQEIASTWLIMKTPENTYEVLSNPTVEVNLIGRTCSCYKWQVQGFPCCHAIAVMGREGSRISELVDPCFYASTYKKVYQHNISAIPTTLKYEFQDTELANKILPPVMKRLPGRPKEKRYIPTVEKKTKQFICGRCGKYGTHYWTTCKEAID